jgi:hypothetical protein
MPHSKLYQLVIDALDAARDLRIEVICHLESQDLIPQANWSLGPR